MARPRGHPWLFTACVLSGVAACGANEWLGGAVLLVAAAWLLVR